MGIIAWLIVGLICGFIAKLILKDHLGWLGTLVAGILGGIVGGFIGNAIMPNANIMGGFNIWTFIWGIIGSIIVLLIWGFISRSMSSRGGGTTV